MYKVTLVLAIVLMCFTAGCALLDQAAPPQLDEQGQPIPGSRQPTELTKAVASAVPYGDVALNVLLLVVAGYEKFRSYKLEKGLKATLLAGKRVSEDPELRATWEKIKAMMKESHESANVMPLIKTMLSKV